MRKKKLVSDAGEFLDINMSRKDRLFYAVNAAIVVLIILLVLIPLINVVASSFSAPTAVSAGKVLLLPVDFTTLGYQKVFQYPMIWQSYANTVFYTVVGTAINIAMTLICAYPLSRRDLPFMGFFIFAFLFTMLFSGGMVPIYINLKNLGLTNTRWAMLLPGALSVYNMIVARTFMQGIPVDLLESASIDGCTDTQYFFKVVIPLSGTLLSVLTLFYAVGHWNAYFSAFLYLIDRDLLPLQILLREVLVANSIQMDQVSDAETMIAMVGMADLLKYALIIVSSVPILILYPIISKYFVKGVLIGSIKG